MGGGAEKGEGLKNSQNVPIAKLIFGIWERFLGEARRGPTRKRGGENKRICGPRGEEEYISEE